MSDFEYISVLLSIILGLGITQLLSGIARLLRDGRSLLPAWWVMVFVAVLLLVHFQVWWASFHWRTLRVWTFTSYSAFMLLPMLLFLMAYLVLPGDLHLDGRELVREFIDRRKSFYALLGLVPLASFLQQHLFGSPLLPDIDTGARVMLLLLAVPGFLSRRIVVQATLSVLYMMLMLVYIGEFFMRLH